MTDKEARGIFTEMQARRLAQRDISYDAIKLQGNWVVWCCHSDHHVEFDEKTTVDARDW